MDYNLIINDKSVSVELEVEEENRFTASFGGNDYAVGYRRIGSNLICLDVDGKKTNAYVADTPEGKTVFINGRTYVINDEDQLNQSGTRKSSGGKTADEITPPMPAVVVSVMVKEGDAVEKGQGVVVVSAMKMETTLYAPFAGTVTKVSVQAGDKVMPGDILVDIAKQESDTDSE